jgi:monofunctional biosynthetic peptidoglycan transglycosylase
MAAKRSFVGTITKTIAYALLIGLCIFAGLLVLYSFTPPISTLMLGRTLTGKSYERTYVRLKDIAPVLSASVIASEDGLFCRHGGVDWGALRKVISEADEDGPSRGASTITMQTAKNLFLWPGRSSIRKGLEIGIALVLGKVWSRAHTLEVYLNIAEWGDGLFGVEAAARHYFQKRASQLNAREAALLATSLPNPILRNAARPRPFQNRLAARIVTRARASAGYLDCLPR